MSRILLEEFRIVRKRHSDPLVDILEVSIHSQPFKPIKRLMQQRLNALKLEENKFLWSEERLMLINVLMN